MLILKVFASVILCSSDTPIELAFFIVVKLLYHYADILTDYLLFISIYNEYWMSIKCCLLLESTPVKD
jgi:hypothetical protein